MSLPKIPIYKVPKFYHSLSTGEPLCPKHNIPLVCYCPACRGEIKSPARAKASAENGKKGGAPKGPRPPK